jgi:hypothetical protein
MAIAILSSLCVGLVLGAGAMFASYRRFSEYEAWASYCNGFRFGRVQGRQDVLKPKGRKEEKDAIS